jgi:hypothetical protein
MGQLERECQSYTRYLIGQPPTPYVVEKYRDFHQKMGAAEVGDRFERFLVAASARGPLWTRLADSYVRVWRKNSNVRKKLVVTLALLECTPPGFQEIDHAPGGGWLGALFRLTLSAAGFACAVMTASLLFGPVHFWMTAGER